MIPNPSGEPTLPATSQDGTTWRALPTAPERIAPVGPAGRLVPRRQRERPHPDAAPDLVRARPRRRGTDRAARPRRRARRRRPDAALDPGHGLERPDRQRPPLRQRRALPLSSARPSSRPSSARSRRATRAASRSPRRTRPATSAARRPRSGPCRCSPASRSRRQPLRSAPPASRSAPSRRPRRPCPRAPSSSRPPPGSPSRRARSTSSSPRSTTAPQTRLAFSVAGSKRIELKKTDDDRRPDQGLEAGAGDGDAARREEPPPPHVDTAGQGRRERGQAPPPCEDPPGHVQADVGRALRHGDDQAHDQVRARRRPLDRGLHGERGADDHEHGAERQPQRVLVDPAGRARAEPAARDRAGEPGEQDRPVDAGPARDASRSRRRRGGSRRRGSSRPPA